MLNLYRRHCRHCAFASMRNKRCRCPIWCWGTLAGKNIRKSLGLSNWEKAQKLIQDWEDAERAQEAPITVQDAAERFIEDAESRNLGRETVAKYRLLFRELDRDFGSLRLEALTVDDLARFREKWKLGPLTARKKIERLRAFLRFCVRREWLRRNPAEALKLPQSKIKPRLPFTAEEWEKILWATEVYPSNSEYLRTRLRAFVLLLRYSGLRIRDAVQLRYDRISEGKLLIYTEKTGSPVWLPLPDCVFAALEKLRRMEQAAHPFWSGVGYPRSQVGGWQRTLQGLFKTAGVHGHAHKFRHTFSVSLLEAGVSLENVAKILGNSAKIVEKHYAPWVRSRQELLEAAVKKTWS